VAIKLVPELAPEPTRAKPERQHSGGWFARMWRQVKLAMAGDDEELLAVNTTTISWQMYHTFHRLGNLDPGESVIFHLRKRGNLNVRPGLECDAVEYLVLDLTSEIQRVEIYRRSMGEALVIYDLRAA
jgi:hypothetical protein